MKQILRMGLLVSPLLVAGCDVLTGPRIELHLATIDTAEALPIVPDSVVQGEPFTVTITIIHNCLDLGPVEQEDFPGGVVLRPYQVLQSKPEVLCPGALRFRPLTDEVLWNHPYDFELQIYARDAWTGAPLSLRYPISVRPNG